MNWLLGNEWLGPLGDIGKIMGGVVAGMAILKGVTAWWQKGPGRRRVWAKNFRLLGPGVRPAYVESLFGEPAFEFEVGAEHLDGVDREPPTERVWMLGEDGYLVTWSSDLRVLAYSITTRSKGFTPKLRIGSGWGSNGVSATVKLGRTVLKDVGAKAEWEPEQVASWVGARRTDYYETYYAGNLGNYTTWACGVSQAGYGRATAGAVERLGPDNSAFISWSDRTQLELEQRGTLDRFRSRATVNSLMVIAMGAPRLLPDMPRSGPDLDIVRTLVKSPGLLGKWKYRRELKRLQEGDRPKRFAWLRLRRGA
ncbi:ETEC_3214 domain-containing protein [Streptomyces sp. NPDC058548]|uniref:ETEC_3214 domain-containing protein n=1 Tax=Streptomyces sp. NPDC058548 TaxID=3346545 RepID=UPI0036660B70